MIGDVFRLADAAEWCLRFSFLLEVASDEAGCVRAFRLDHSGVERIDANLLGPEFACQG